ncbi:unnamed protein product [Spodoptera exigua]|nr:unnamed protein product [Spodoptera exigua]
MAGPARQWRACWRRWRVLALAAAALGALRVRVPAQVAATHRLPALAPAALAHSLADFSNQPDISSWWVEEDHSNYTTWRYSVSFECGTWCRGRGVVVAADEPAGRAPQHGRAVRSHHVSVVRRDCSALPLLPWPQLCDEVEVRAVVSGASEGDGSQLQWMARAGCGALGWAAGACARRLQRHALALERLLRV